MKNNFVHNLLWSVIPRLQEESNFHWKWQKSTSEDQKSEDCSAEKKHNFQWFSKNINRKPAEIEVNTVRLEPIKFTKVSDPISSIFSYNLELSLKF